MSSKGPELDTLLRLILVAALSLGFMARVATYKSPLFDFHSWRQADTATIARNFATEYFNPLYPQIDARGAQPNGFVETGFEIHAFAVAVVAKVAGFDPALGRVLSALLFPITALLMFRFVRTRYGDDAGVVALVLWSFCLPLTLYMERAFMNEAALALLTVLCLRAAQQYCERSRPLDLAAMAVSSLVIAVVKPTYLIVWAPVLGLFLERYGTRALLRWELWTSGALSVAGGVLWFTHARTLAETTGLSFGLADKLFSTEILFSGEYLLKIARRLAADLLGPVGVVCVVVGTVLAVRRGKTAEALGLAGFGIYLVVVTGGNFHHNYYQLPVVPIAVVAASLGVTGIAAALARRRGWNRAGVLSLYTGILWLAAMTTFVRSVSAHNWYELDRSRQRLCEDVRPLLMPSDRVVFANERNPDVLFCLDRKGWLLNYHESNATYLRRFVAAGATIAIIRKGDALQTDLEGMGARLVETPDYLAYRLKTE